MDKLTLDKWPPQEREWVLELQQILEHVDGANLPRHAAMIDSAPHSATEDDIWIQEPSVYSLLAYGVDGVEALFNVAMSDSRGMFDARRALVSVANGEPRSSMAVVERTKRYMDDVAHEQLMARVTATLADPKAKVAALRLLSDTIRAIVTDPKKRHEITTFIGTFGTNEDLVWDLLTKSVLNITNADLQRLRELVDQDLDEREYQRFLEEHPVILDPVASSIIRVFSANLRDRN